MEEQNLDSSDLLADVFRSDYQWLTHKLRYRLGCGEQAEDLACEAFTQLAALPRLEAVRESRAMLMTIANRVVYEVRRRKSLERSHLATLAHRPKHYQASPERKHLLLDELEAMEKALWELPEKARQAFYYKQLDGLTYAEIGLRLGVSASMVRQYLANALAKCSLARHTQAG